MKKYLCIFLFFIIAVSGAMAQNIDTTDKHILFAYEINDKNIDPWRTYFRNEFTSSNYTFEEIEASKLSTISLSNYDYIIVYGAVMAFTSKEPIRDWLNTKPKFAGKNVWLFVTANRWFLKKYNDQLLDLLKKADATIVDVVSTATKKLNDREKQQLVHTYVEKIK